MLRVRQWAGNNPHPSSSSIPAGKAFGLLWIFIKVSSWCAWLSPALWHSCMCHNPGYKLCSVTIVPRSGTQWFADWFSVCAAVSRVDSRDFPHSCYVLLCAPSWAEYTVQPKEDLSSQNNGNYKFLHHYELFRCPLLDVHIWEARDPSKSNIKYKWDLYEPIFIYSLLLRSACFLSDSSSDSPTLSFYVFLSDKIVRNTAYIMPLISYGIINMWLYRADEDFFVCFTHDSRF